jgi:hypothetical protein
MAVSCTKQKLLCVGENKIGVESYPHLSTDEKIEQISYLVLFLFPNLIETERHRNEKTNTQTETAII